MPAVAIDTHKLLRALKSTGKGENFSAEDLVRAFDAAQSDGDGVTRAYFDARIAGVGANVSALGTRMDSLEGRMGALEGRMTRVEARLEHFEARIDTFDTKLDTVRAELRLEVRSAQLQSLFWLAGIMLVSNGAVIALMGRIARLY